VLIVTLGKSPQLRPLDASGLLHDTCAGKIVAALFKNIPHVNESSVPHHGKSDRR
jgi:hypothetical protein